MTQRDLALAAKTLTPTPEQRGSAASPGFGKRRKSR